MACIAQGASAPSFPTAILQPASLTQSAPIVGQPHIYVLPLRDRSQVKIGRSLDPVQRISGLKRTYPEIDLSRSLVVAVDDLVIEDILHWIFGPRWIEPVERRDGGTEWFSGDIRDEVIDLCLRIARHRQADYRVIRGLSSLVPERLPDKPAAELRARRIKPVRPPVEPCPDNGSLEDMAIRQSRQFLRILNCSPFAEILVRGSRYYLTRLVERRDEPEPWNTRYAKPTLWSRRLACAAGLPASGKRGGFPFPFVSQSILIVFDYRFGREYFPLSKELEEALRSEGSDVMGPLGPALTMIRERLLQLPRRIDDSKATSESRLDRLKWVR